MHLCIYASMYLCIYVSTYLYIYVFVDGEATHFMDSSRKAIQFLGQGNGFIPMKSPSPKLETVG